MSLIFISSLEILWVIQTLQVLIFLKKDALIRYLFYKILNFILCFLVIKIRHKPWDSGVADIHITVWQALLFFWIWAFPNSKHEQGDLKGFYPLPSNTGPQLTGPEVGPWPKMANHIPSLPSPTPTMSNGDLTQVYLLPSNTGPQLIGPEVDTWPKMANHIPSSGLLNWIQCRELVYLQQ